MPRSGQLSAERSDDRTHDIVNQIVGRDTDDDSTDDHNPVHLYRGGIEADDEDYTYKYDVWGRLVEVNETGSGDPVARYGYNGNGFRITSTWDSDTDGDIDGNDEKVHFAYGPNWTMLAVIEEGDEPDKPTEEFVYDNAGASGMGSSSYIDEVILRDRDTDDDEVLDERIYILQNWRHDVVWLVTDMGAQVEQVRYSAYGAPTNIPAGDTDQDGDVDATDTSQIQTWIDAPAYDVRGDLNLSGNVNTTDKTIAAANTNTGGWGVLSGSDYANRKGYAGYEFDDIVAGAQSMWHVRHRVLNSDLGRWMTRDPLGFVDGVNVYLYAQSTPLMGFDALGLDFPGEGTPNPGAPFPPFPPIPTTPGLFNPLDIGRGVKFWWEERLWPLRSRVCNQTTAPILISNTYTCRVLQPGECSDDNADEGDFWFIAPNWYKCGIGTCSPTDANPGDGVAPEPD